MKKEEINYERWLGQLKKDTPHSGKSGGIDRRYYACCQGGFFQKSGQAQTESCCLVFGHCCNFALGDMGSRNDVC